MKISVELIKNIINDSQSENTTLSTVGESSLVSAKSSDLENKTKRKYTRLRPLKPKLTPEEKKMRQKRSYQAYLERKKMKAEGIPFEYVRKRISVIDDEQRMENRRIAARAFKQRAKEEAVLLVLLDTVV